MDEFRKIVLEDAENIVDRQENDSVTIIDEVRFYLREFSTLRTSDVEEMDMKMKSVEDFLETLGLIDS